VTKFSDRRSDFVIWDTFSWLGVRFLIIWRQIF